LPSRYTGGGGTIHLKKPRRIVKSTVQQIQRRFDADVERFSNLREGQSATVDSPLCMELIAAAAAAVTPRARDLLDIGCGAGNYTLKLLERLPEPAELNCTLLDLSRPMLDRAVQRVSLATQGRVQARQGDMRRIEWGPKSFDIVLAASTLHHLRGGRQWRMMFEKIHRCLRAGGSFWVFDLVRHGNAAVQAILWERYGRYLMGLKGGGAAGRAYRDKVFAYVAAEDTPRPLAFQLDLMREVGFVDVEVLHKSGPFAAFGGGKR
jgi:tRNA (cmo5U34)-methyltransferase